MFEISREDRTFEDEKLFIIWLFNFVFCSPVIGPWAMPIRARVVSAKKKPYNKVNPFVQVTQNPFSRVSCHSLPKIQRFEPRRSILSPLRVGGSDGKMFGSRSGRTPGDERTEHSGVGVC